MLAFEFAGGRGPRTVLLLGAHCDDIEIGCGGTAAKLAERYPQTKFVWVTFCSDAIREAETRAAASRILRGAADVTLEIKSFRESYLPQVAADLKDYFETLKRFSPDLVITHARHDLHQDHHAINQLTWNTFRNHAIWEYEILKFDGDLGAPSLFVPLTKQEMSEKVAMLLESFPSQRGRQWFTRDSFEAIGRIRGIECNAQEGFAEAFYVRKQIVGL